MGNSWTRLVQEAAKHGGPNELRQHYANAGARAGAANGRLGGFVLGFAVPLAGAGIGWAANKTVELVIDRRKASAGRGADVAEAQPNAPEKPVDHPEPVS